MNLNKLLVRKGTIIVLVSLMAIFILSNVFVLVLFISNKKVVSKSIKETNAYYAIYNSYISGLDINKKIADLEMDDVVDFYNTFTLNGRISEAIIRESLANNVPVNLSFALAWGESRFRFDVVKIGNRNGTSDWGLFQLNSAGRLGITMKPNEMLNIEKNTKEAITLLKFLLNESGDNEAVALTAYNAGSNAVDSADIGSLTISHVGRILKYENQLDAKFNIRFKQ